MIEPLELEERQIAQPEKPWAVTGVRQTRQNLINSIYLETDQLEAHIRHLEEKYRRAQEEEARHELYLADDAEVLVVGYGIVSRVLRSAVEQVRKFGLRAGLFRPITLWPFPSQALQAAAARCRSVLVVELSNGQMVEDVRLALGGGARVEFYGRCGGNVPAPDEIRDRLLAHAADLVTA
jgi:pyruvate/2-oxoacid:ferredoxin oxidoreductase alpha subunit